MVFLYNLIFILFALSYLPVFLIKLRQADDKKRLLGDRLGLLSAQFKKHTRGRSIIWVHAVSVGEVLAVQNFLDRVRERFPDHTIVLSTVTPTGNRVARQVASEKAQICYLPFDISMITNKVLAMLEPRVVILIETELWPNLIISAKRVGARVAIVNGRLSPRSFRNYYRIKGLLRDVFSKVDVYLMQTERYRKRLQRISGVTTAIHVTGNMKFDNLTFVAEDTALALERRTKCGFLQSDMILIAASTHRGEEKIVLDMYRTLRLRYPQLKVLIAPRHIERVNEIARLIRKARLAFTCANQAALESGLARAVNSTAFDVYILNTIGELKTIYTIADIVLMGGSFVRHGGQNPLEALVFGKPVITGPHVFNFAEVYERLLEHQAVMKVSSPAECMSAVGLLLDNYEKRATMVDNAYAVIQELQGASQRNCDYIAQLLGR